jgi:HEAT repeat protein
VSVSRVGRTIALGLVLGASTVRAAEPRPADAKPAQPRPTDAATKPAPAKAAGAKSAGAKAEKKKGAKDRSAGDDAADKKALSAGRLDAARAALSGEDDAAAIAAAESLGGSGAGNAAEPLAELLAAGAAPARTEATLDALAKLGAAGALTAGRAFEVIDLYTGHHAPEIRERAVKALGTIKDPRVIPTLLARLGDAAPGVRAAAGEALAARHERSAIPRLFALVKRGDAGAASPLAALATPDLIPHVAELAGTVDDGVVATTLGDYAQRGDVPDRLRLDVVRTIAKLAGVEATTALVEYVASVPAKDDRPSKREAQKLLDERETAK